MYDKDLYLFLTNACPNRCKYCYIKYGYLSMTEEDIDRYINEYKPKRIIFFGGEPLVRIDLFKYTVKKYWDSGIIFQLVTSTMANWDEFVEFYKEYRIPELQVSWDGFTDSRIGADGTPIDEKVWNNIMKLIFKMIYGWKEKPNFDIKTVINNKNIDELLSLHYWYMFFKSGMVPNYTGIAGQFVIAHGEDYDENFYEILKRDLPKTFDIDHLYIDHMNKIISYLDRADRCSCDIGKYRTITPDGKVGCCTALSQYDYEINEQLAQERCTSPECNDCEYSYMCDGGCRYERYLKYGEEWPNKHLDCTCRIMKIWDNSIKSFLNSLDKNGKIKLREKIKDHKSEMYKRYGVEMK